MAKQVPTVKAKFFLFSGTFWLIIMSIILELEPHLPIFVQIIPESAQGYFIAASTVLFVIGRQVTKSRLTLNPKLHGKEIEE